MERYLADDYSDGVHVIEILFQYDDYKASRTIEIGGNCVGWGVLDNSVDYLRYEDSDESDVIVLTNPEGDTISVPVDDVEPYVVGVRIVDFKPDGENDDYD